MIRPFTIVCMLMAVGSGLYLYQCKHQAQMLDREIARTIKQTEAARDRIGMLRAEWAQLNEPDRIADLARAHSQLQTAKPTQFIAVTELAGKLPAPVAPSHSMQPTDLPEDSEVPPVAQAEPPAAPVPAPRVAAVAPAAVKPIVHAVVAPETKPVQIASPAPMPESKPLHHVLAASVAAAPTPVVTPAQPQFASVHPLARPMAPPHTFVAASVPNSGDAVAPGTVGAAVLRAMRSRETPHEAGPAIQPVVEPARSYAPPAYTPPSYAPQAYAAPMVGSMLGGRSSALPPPVPFAAR